MLFHFLFISYLERELYGLFNQINFYSNYIFGISLMGVMLPLTVSASDKNEKFPKNWFLDNLDNNISKKNKNFGSLTSIYWIWKNELKKYKENTWIGISHYKRF